MVTPFFRSSVVQVGHLPHMQFRKESQKVLKWLICELNDLFIFHVSEIYFSWFCCFLWEIPDVIKKKVVLSFFSYINTLQIDRIYVKSSFSKVFTMHRTYRDSLLSLPLPCCVNSKTLMLGRFNHGILYYH